MLLYRIPKHVFLFLAFEVAQIPFFENELPPNKFSLELESRYSVVK